MNVIRHWRLKSGLTQSEIAKTLKIDRSTIAKWEAGKSQPRFDKLPQLASILSCNINDLFEH